MDWQRRKADWSVISLLMILLLHGAVHAQDGDWVYEEMVTEKQGTQWMDSLDIEEEEKEFTGPVLVSDEDYESASLPPADLEPTEWQDLIGDKNYTQADRQEFDELELDPPGSFDFNPTILRWLLIVLIAGVFIFLLVRFASVDRVYNRKVAGLDIQELDRAEENLQESNLERVLRLALDAKDYRSALRVRYLMVLKALDASGRIIHEKDKTNLNYIRELKGQPEQSKFIELSRVFEYVWYAEIEVPQHEDQLFAEKFNTYLDSLHVRS